MGGDLGPCAAEPSGAGTEIIRVCTQAAGTGEGHCCGDQYAFFFHVYIKEFALSLSLSLEQTVKKGFRSSTRKRKVTENPYWQVYTRTGGSTGNFFLSLSTSSSSYSCNSFLWRSHVLSEHDGTAHRFFSSSSSSRVEQDISQLNGCITTCGWCFFFFFFFCFGLYKTEPDRCKLTESRNFESVHGNREFFCCCCFVVLPLVVAFYSTHTKGRANYRLSVLGAYKSNHYQ